VGAGRGPRVAPPQELDSLPPPKLAWPPSLHGRQAYGRAKANLFYPTLCLLRLPWPRCC
jgi:hypothetical protein